MGQKFKPRQQKKPRSFITRDMLLTRHGGEHSDKRIRRNKKNKWKGEEES
jgi:hypothetical protein